jgi:hypothetical protein
MLGHMRIAAFLRQYPQVVFSPYILNVALYLWLLTHGARFKGVAISAVLAVGGLWFVFLCVRGGFVMGHGRTETVEGQPRSFWASMVLIFGIYLFFTAAAVVLYLQDIGYLKQ